MKALRQVALPAAVGAVAVVVFHALGVQTEFAWGWGIMSAAVALLTGIRMPEDPRLDAPGRPADHRYIGSEVSRLAWAINTETDTVNEAVTRRVRATLRRRLMRVGVDVDDISHAAAVDRHLGAGLWPRLTGRRTTIRDIRDGLAAAERLHPLSAATSQQTPPSRQTYEPHKETTA